ATRRPAARWSSRPTRRAVGSWNVPPLWHTLETREPPHRVETETGVPPRRVAIEEFETRLRAGGERLVLGEAQLALLPQLRVLRQHVARQALHHVRLGVFLALEDRVEETPRQERVGGLRL